MSPLWLAHTQMEIKQRTPIQSWQRYLHRPNLWSGPSLCR